MVISIRVTCSCKIGKEGPRNIMFRDKPIQDEVLICCGGLLIYYIDINLYLDLDSFN
jgi:hypothetical protein